MLRQPNSLYIFYQIDQGLETEWFDKVRIGAKGVGLANIFVEFGTRQNHDRHSAHFGVLPDPLEQLKTGRARHFQVEQDEGWQRMLESIGIGWDTVEVGHRLLAVFDVLQIEMSLGAAGGGAQQLGIVEIIINVQNGKNFRGKGLGRARSAAWPPY